jgi:hypothetical protein
MASSRDSDFRGSDSRDLDTRDSDSRDSGSGGSDSRGSDRLRDIEARLTALESRKPPAASALASPAENADTFWALDGLKARIPDPGGVLYTGRVVTAAGPVEWQFGVLVDDLLDRDWSLAASPLAALGNPVRLSILQLVIGGVSTVAELVAAGELGSSGQVYHHVNQLVSAGWLAPGARGQFSIPGERVVPLLAILTASGAVR